MNKSYEFKKNDNARMSKLKLYKNDLETSSKIFSYQENMIILKHFLYKVLSIPCFYIRFLKQVDSINYFEITYNNKKYLLKMVHDYIVLESEYLVVGLMIEPVWDNHNYHVNMYEITYRNDTRGIIEKFYSHEMVLEFVFYPERKFIFKVPIDLDEDLEPFIFQSIKKSASMIELIRFYRKILYPKQSEYDKKKCKTCIQIMDKNILMDQVELEDGKITSYEINTILNGTILSLKNGEYTIKNLTDGLDLNMEIKKLQRRLHKIL